jgi:hypothetical protein
MGAGLGDQIAGDPAIVIVPRFILIADDPAETISS